MANIGYKIVLGPEREVISIYNDNFATPKDRDPYFIEVYRCVAVITDEDKVKCGGHDYPVPHTWTNITIVVPDLGKNSTFYKYVIYNHTSCKCGDRKLSKKPVEELGECLKWIQIFAALCIYDDGVVLFNTSLGVISEK